ncbi:MAG: hypothetical protein AAF703_07230 [Cyanobacteria bacterium P01_D01_bin.105]
MVRFSKVSKSCATGLALSLSLIISGCATSPETVVDSSTTQPTPIEAAKEDKPGAGNNSTQKEPPVSAQTDAQIEGGKQPDTDSEMVTVSVYTIDEQCNEFVQKTVQVPGDQAISEAVGKAMGAIEYNAFKLEGYQVDVTGNTAIVDMKLSPGSERQFVSLSSCEQRALFGSVEETLLNNPEWEVNAVKFTHGGKELIL